MINNEVWPFRGWFYPLNALRVLIDALKARRAIFVMEGTGTLKIDLQIKHYEKQLRYFEEKENSIFKREFPPPLLKAMAVALEKRLTTPLLPPHV